MAKAARRSRTRGRPVKRSRGRPASKSRSRSTSRSRGRSNKKKRRSKKVGGNGNSVVGEDGNGEGKAYLETFNKAKIAKEEMINILERIKTDSSNLLKQIEIIGPFIQSNEIEFIDSENNLLRAVAEIVDGELKNKLESITIV
jgi:hypothetical protein